MPSTANFYHRCGQQLNLSEVLNKAARPVDKGKLLKEYFHQGYPYAAIVSLLGKRHGVRIHAGTLKRKLKKRPRKLRPVRRYFVATFTLISCRSNIILNFIYVGKATQINYVNLREVYQHIVEHETWRAFSKISGYGRKIRWIRVDASRIRKKKFAFSQISGYVWTGSQKYATSDLFQ